MDQWFGRPFRNFGQELLVMAERKRSQGVFGFELVGCNDNRKIKEQTQRSSDRSVNYFMNNLGKPFLKTRVRMFEHVIVPL